MMSTKWFCRRFYLKTRLFEENRHCIVFIFLSNFNDRALHCRKFILCLVLISGHYDLFQGKAFGLFHQKISFPMVIISIKAYIKFLILWRCWQDKLGMLSALQSLSTLALISTQCSTLLLHFYFTPNIRLTYVPFIHCNSFRRNINTGVLLQKHKCEVSSDIFYRTRVRSLFTLVTN